MGEEAVMGETDLEQSLITDYDIENVECATNHWFHVSNAEASYGGLGAKIT